MHMIAAGLEHCKADNIAFCEDQGYEFNPPMAAKLVVVAFLASGNVHAGN